MYESAKNARVKHCVFMKMKPETSELTKSSIFELLDGLPKEELGIVEMVHGPLVPSPSGPDLSRGYTDGLSVTFQSVEDRNRYNVDPGHQRILNDEIIPNVVGGVDGLLRFDFVEASVVV